MPNWRQAVSLRIREQVLRHYLVPYSRSGLDAGLVPHLPRNMPISLIDIGASRGDFAAAVIGHSGIRRALLVEPQEERCAELRRRFLDPTVEVMHCALLDHSGIRDLHVLGADSCSSLLRVNANAGFRGRQIDVSIHHRERISVTTLDDLVTRQQWHEPIDLLKLDTQGTELPILRGAGRTLPRVRLLWIEVSFRSLYEGDALFSQIHDYLRHSCFRLFSLHDVFRAVDGELLQADALFLGPSAQWSAG